MGNRASTEAATKESPNGTPATLAEFDKFPAHERQKVFDTMVARLRGSTGGTWAEFQDIDMCGQGDTKIIHDWKNSRTLDEMKQMVEKNNWSAITVSRGEPSFGHAALKDFDFALKPEHCKPITSCCKHPCTIYIYTPPPEFTKTGELPVKVQMSADESAGKLILVKAGASSQCVFEHAESLRVGNEFVPLTVASGQAIVSSHVEERVHEHYHLFSASVGMAEHAVVAKLDQEGFLTCQDTGFVLDIDKWQYFEGNHLWMLREHSNPNSSDTRRPDGGRSFKVNVDGTMSPVKAPELVLGVKTPESNKACVTYEQKDVPADFPLPIMGDKFILASSFDDKATVLEIFCHQVNCPLVFSYCCTAQCAHWYVSAIDPSDGSFKLSILWRSGQLNARLNVVDSGEALSAVMGDGSWFLAEKHGDACIRVKSRENPSLYLTACSTKACWGGRVGEMNAELGEGNILHIKPIKEESEEE